jgi:hypothetical protein
MQTDLEPVYTPKQVAAWLQCSIDTVRRLFRGDPRTIDLSTHARRRGTQSYTVLRIPHSAIIDRFPYLRSQPQLQSDLASPAVQE